MPGEANQGMNIRILYTTAIAQAGGPVAADTETTESIKRQTTDFLKSTHLMATFGNLPVAFELHMSLPRLFEFLSSKASPLIVCPIENSEVGSFRSVYECIVAHSAFIVGEFALRSVVHQPDGESPRPHALWTRYVIVSQQQCPRIKSYFRADMKASLVLGLSHQAGSISKILSCFSMRDISVLKFEMRAAVPFSYGPSPFLSGPTSLEGTDEGCPAPFLTSHPAQWSYLFYVDYAVPCTENVNAALLVALKEFSVTLVELGIYEQNLSATSPDTRGLSRGLSASAFC